MNQWIIEPRRPYGSTGTKIVESDGTLVAIVYGSREQQAERSEEIVRLHNNGRPEAEKTAEPVVVARKVADFTSKAGGGNELPE